MVPESICNHQNYNRIGPVINGNALNWFKGHLEACAVAGGINCELIFHMAFHSNEYAHLKTDNNGKFAGYMWCNISVMEIYYFIGILLKISLIFLDID